MALLGSGAIAMWWDIAPTHRAAFEDWHTHEHFPERLAIPGFLRGSRWGAADDGEGFFVMYELETYETVASAGYLARLNAPTPWSTQMMPHHRHMVRSQCRVLESRGGALSRHALTVRLAPDGDAGEGLRAKLAAWAQQLSDRAGTAGAHLLKHQTPEIETTKEQDMRGGPDPSADWIFVVCGYDRTALEAVSTELLSEASLVSAGALPGAIRGLYTLSHSNTAGDVGG